MHQAKINTVDSWIQAVDVKGPVHGLSRRDSVCCVQLFRQFERIERDYVSGTKFVHDNYSFRHQTTFISAPSYGCLVTQIAL